jgi:hypothetical protein
MVEAEGIEEDEIPIYCNLVVARPNDWWQIIMDLHNEIGHFGEGRTLVEMNKRYFWHNRTIEVKDVVCFCKQCHLVKSTRCIRLELEEFKSIPIWD